MVDVAQLHETQRAANAVKPDGAITSTGLTLPASTVDGVNDTGYDVIGRISAGTVTVVKVDGVTLGGLTTGEWIFVRAGSTFNITYSVAPTLQWFRQ